MRCRRVKGSVTMLQTKARAPPTAIPTMRKGRSKSQTIGYRISAAMATGQHRTNRIHQSKKVTILIRIRDNLDASSVDGGCRMVRGFEIKEAQVPCNVLLLFVSRSCWW